jgi:hypothetical protein
MTSYTPRNVKDFAQTPKTTDSPNQSKRYTKDQTYVRFKRTHSGDAEGVNYTPGNNERFSMGWSGTGQWTYDNGEWECRMNNGGTIGGYGGMQTLMNGNIVNSSGGSNSTRSTGNECHVADAGTGVGGGGQAASGKAAGTSKSSADKHACQVYPGDYGMVVGGTCGILADSMNMKTQGNFAMGSTDGVASFTGRGNAAFGSQEGTTMVGGKGVTVASQGGGTSIRAVGGNMSVFSEGGNCFIKGGMVYINSSNNPPETPQQVVNATGSAGKK